MVERVAVSSREQTPAEKRRSNKALSTARHIAAVARSAAWSVDRVCAAEAALVEAERAAKAEVPLHRRVAVYIAPTGERYPAERVDRLVHVAPEGATISIEEINGARWIVATWSRAPGCTGAVGLRPHEEPGA